LLPTDDVVQTRVRTAAGWLSFQEYFVREQCKPEVLELAYDGLEDARSTQAALAAIAEADLILLAPSNPLVSITPILDVPEIRAAVEAAEAPVWAVSPLINGKVVKGPADQMMKALGLRADALGIAEFYNGLIDGLVIDELDAGLAEEIMALGTGCSVLPTLMTSRAEKEALAAGILEAVA